MPAKLGDNINMNGTLIFARVRQFAPLLLVLFSALVAIAVFLQALDYQFVYDDTVYASKNAKLAALLPSELWRLFTQPYNDFSEFLPLRDFSYWFDITLFGLNPAAFRVHNILLYLLSLPLVYAATLELWRYFRKTDANSAAWAAAAVTALFALHPAMIESVVWISGRKYVLANLFAMLALWLALRARQENGLSVPYAVATLVAFVAVMLSKTSYVAVAPVIALFWVIFWFDTPQPERRRVQLLWPGAIMFLTWLLGMIFVATGQGYIDVSGGAPPVFDVDTINRSLAVLGWLARLAISLEGRHFLYPVYSDPYFAAMIALGVVIVAAVVAGAVMLLRRRSLTGLALIIFLLICMPYLQLIPYAPPSLVQDRFLALALWPVVLLIVALLWHFKPYPRAFLLLVIVSAWCFQTTQRLGDWRSFETLIDADMRAFPGYYMPASYKITSFQLQRELYDEARDTANGITMPEVRDAMIKIIEADRAVYSAATGTTQQAVELLWQLGEALKHLPAQARQDLPLKNLWEMSQVFLSTQWTTLIKRFPDDLSVRYNYGLWLLSVPKDELAAEEFRAVIDSKQWPESARGEVFVNLGVALMHGGHIIEAEDALRAALEQSPPDLRAYCLLVDVFKQAGKLQEAVRAGLVCRKR